MPEPILDVVDLKKHFPISKNAAVHAVDGVSFRVNRGEVLGLVGESGCGKTTTGRTVLRLVEPDHGQVVFEGRDILKFGPKEMNDMRKQMQIIFQDPFSSLDPRKNVGQLVSEPLRIHRAGSRREIRDRVAHLLEKVGLSKDMAGKYPHELDGGRCQRVGIARALALEPKFIVCDEPVSALDVSIQAQILNLLQDLQEQLELTYLFISHNLGVVKHVSNQIMVMYLGVAVEVSEAEELFARPLHPYTQALLSAIPVPAVTREKERVILSGDVPTPVNPGPGCRFYKRCRIAEPRCAESEPSLLDAVGGHKVACHRVRT